MVRVIAFFVSLTAAAQVPKVEIARRLAAVEDTNFKRELRLQAMFEEVGCKGDNLIEQRVKHAQAPNLICTLPGDSPTQIVVGGHFDFVDRGKGVVDNWSGSSLLPSLFEDLHTARRRHTFVFIGFTNEEAGLVGSRFYVHQLSKEQRKNIQAMVNLDTLGLSSSAVDAGDKTLTLDLLAVAGRIHVPLRRIVVTAVGRSDSDSFRDAHIPAITIHSLTQETVTLLHSPRDQMSAIQMDDYYNTYLLVRAFLAYLDQL
ncbi:MAG TPA: M28 family peptidase [Bryobacteraceae bacterium]|nr:M28 family peptidase [Bryobacteraceae bacterium]